MHATPMAMRVLIASGCAWVTGCVICTAACPLLQYESTKARRLQANTSVLDNTSLSEVWLPPLPDVRSLSSFSFALVRPHQWMPQPAQLTDPTERTNRFIYWRTALFLVGVIGMSVMETYRVAIAAFRHSYHKGLERVPMTPNAQEEHVVSFALARRVHICNQLVCASICGYAAFTGHLGFQFGLCYELVLVWLVMTLTDLTVQVVVRAATIEHGAKQGTVANKAILAIAPGANDRTDILMDWIMIGVMFHHGGIAICLGFLSLVDLCYVYTRIYSNPGLMEELRDDFFNLLTPQDTGSIGFLDAWRSSKIKDFLVQQAVGATANLKRELALWEELPQACLKALFIATCGGGWFVFSYMVFALVKLLGMAIAVLLLAEHGTNKQLRQKVKGGAISGERAVALEALVERASVGDGQTAALSEHAGGEGRAVGPGASAVAAVKDSPEVFHRRDPEAVAAVLQCLEDEDRAVRETAMKSLPKVFQRGDPEAVAAVLKGIEDEDPAVREAAIANLHMVRSVAVARSYLKHEDREVRKKAAEVVSQLGGFSAAERASRAGYRVARTAYIGGAVVVGAPIAICATIVASPLLLPAALYWYCGRRTQNVD